MSFDPAAHVTKIKGPEYRAWNHMKDRCLNRRHPNYKDYGGRGITICEAWKQSFAAFLYDIGTRPSPQHSLERRNNALGYTPGNAEWAIKKDQTRNTRRNRLVTFGNRSLPLVVWAEIRDMSPKTLWTRLLRWRDVERALYEPVMSRVESGKRSAAQRLKAKGACHGI